LRTPAQTQAGNVNQIQHKPSTTEIATGYGLDNRRVGVRDLEASRILSSH
jgi:hypothetical protein